MGSVIVGDFNTRLDLPIDHILDGAKAAELSPCIVIGRNADGEFQMFATTSDVGKILVLLERGKRLVMEWVD